MNDGATMRIDCADDDDDDHDDDGATAETTIDASTIAAMLTVDAIGATTTLRAITIG